MCFLMSGSGAGHVRGDRGHLALAGRRRSLRTSLNPDSVMFLLLAPITLADGTNQPTELMAPITAGLQ